MPKSEGYLKFSPVCRKRDCHEDKAAAQAQAERLPGTQPYYCPRCGAWHVGHVNQTVRLRTGRGVPTKAEWESIAKARSR